MRDPQIVLAATFDHLFIYLFIFIFNISFGEFGYLEKKKKKKAVSADRYGPTNSVKNIE